MRGAVWVLAAAGLVALAALLPLISVAGAAVDIGWTKSIALIVRPRVGELLVNTVLLTVLCLPICATLGLALAWLTERTDLPGRRFWSVLLVAPLAVSAFVHGYAWTSLVPSLHGLFAGVMISTLAYFPFLYLPIAATLRRLDPTLEDVATSLGMTPARVFRRVVLPQLKLPIWGGALLIGLHLLAEYGLYAMIRFDTFTTAIYDQFQSTFNGAAAQMLASVLAALCLLLLVVEAGTRGRARYARLGAGSARQAPLVSLSMPWVLAATVLAAAVVVLALGVPLLTLGRWLVMGGLRGTVWGEVLATLLQTVKLAAIGALVTLAAALPAAWLSVRQPGRFSRLLEGSNYISGSLPGIVVALALVSITLRFAQPLYQTLAMVVLTYLILFLPRAMISLRASLAQAPVELENVARSLGRSPVQALWSVTLRLAAPGAAAGAALVFLAIANELTATLLLAPIGTRTLATTFWSLTSEADYAAAAPYAVMLVLLSLPLTWLLYVQSRKAAGR